MTKFVGLHIHSDYSLLDGASQLPQLVDRVVELGMPAIALTDHGVMYGAIELIKVCRARNVKPIIGNEMYIINWELGKPYKGKKYHQVVLAKNTQGYKNLVKLTTISHLQGFQGKGIFARPCINKEVLEQYHEGLIVTSACLGGEIPQAILQNKPELARETAKWYKDVFGDDYYLEIQDHGSQEDRIVNVEIVKIAQDLGIKIIATNDSHFTSCNDVEAHDALLCIQTGKLITEDKRMRYSGTEYLKSAAEMALLFRDHLPEEIITQAIQNTLEIAEKVQPYDIMGQPRIPKYPVPSGHTMDTWLEEKTWEGLLERFGYRSRSEIEPIYKERIEFELNVMQQAGFSSYFLVVWDYIKYARDQKIPVGPGRGSAAGSLVAYALGITNIDPVHHGLLFERFLNPERKSMPDIDTDFCIDRRDDMIKYVSEKYGEDKVAQIITFNRLTSKSVLKDVARVLDIPYKESDEMAKMIPVVRGKPTKLKVMISPETPAPEFRERYLKDERVHHWLDMAMRIEGTNKTYGVHAAGVVISSESLDEIVPLQKNNDGTVITQYFMEDLESLGLLKMDFLGLKNLTIIQKTIELIHNNKSLDLDPDQFPKDERKTQAILARGTIKKMPDDIKKTYQILEKGDLEGIFQLESSGMRQIVRDLKPSCIEDISSILALYRPGPLDAGLIPKFIDRKHGREKIQYEHPLLEPILNETYAVLVYQEQIMKMAQDLAGYTLGQADLLRRCLSGSTQIVDVGTGNLVSLQEIAKKPNYWLGRKVFCLDLRTQKIVQQPIIEIHDNGVREVWEITTKTNRKIKATTDHLFYTLLGWQPLADFKIGDRIGLTKSLPITNLSTISDAQIKLTAYLLGDGHLSTKHAANSYFCNSDPELIADFNQCAEELFGKVAPIDYQLHPGRSTVAYARIGCLRGFNLWVDSHIKRAHSNEKEIPDWVFSLSTQQLQLFLGTLWSTDGSFDTKIGHTDYTSTSPVMIRQIQNLLLRLGIVSLFNTKVIQYKGKPHKSYRSQITGKEDVLKFDAIIKPYLSLYKQEKAQQCYEVIKDKLKNQSKHTIPPEVISLIGEAKSSRGITWAEIDQAVNLSPGTMSSGLNFQKPPTRSLARHRVENFAIALQDQRLQAIANSEVFWDEIISIECIGLEQVFDLTIPEHHNFIANDFIAHNCMGKKKADEMQKQRETFIDGSTRNGVTQHIAEHLFDQMVIFAEYCFNKSHSTAYAYVTYQTAYLKANYPTEYMSALLSSNSEDQEKVQRYIATCVNLQIDVLPPDINHSEYDFTPVDNLIMFGLGAVRNLGEGAILSILEARRSGGEFISLADFCDRINLSSVNSRSLEALVKSGAFDKLNPNRRQAIEHLKILVAWSQNRAKDRESGQSNIFDLMSADIPESKGLESAPEAPNIADFSKEEKLQSEKELLGFYISDHPLKAAKNAYRVMAPNSLADIAEMKSKALVTILVMLIDVKNIVTKKGDRMAVVQMEDISGSKIEGVVFPKAYDRLSEMIILDAQLVVWGKIDDKEDQKQIIIEDAAPLQTREMILLEFLPQQLNEATFNSIKALLKEQSGKKSEAKVPVLAKISPTLSNQLVRLPNEYWVENSQAAVKALRDAGFAVSTRSFLA